MAAKGHVRAQRPPPTQTLRSTVGSPEAGWSALKGQASTHRGVAHPGRPAPSRRGRHGAKDRASAPSHDGPCRPSRRRRRPGSGPHPAPAPRCRGEGVQVSSSRPGFLKFPLLMGKPFRADDRFIDISSHSGRSKPMPKDFPWAKATFGPFRLRARIGFCGIFNMGKRKSHKCRE